MAEGLEAEAPEWGGWQAQELVPALGESASVLNAELLFPMKPDHLVIP